VCGTLPVYMFLFLLRGSPKVVLLRAALMIALIGLADWRDRTNLPLGFLYLFPMLLAGSAVNRWWIAGTALLCTVLTEAFDNFAWSPESGIPRDILYFAAFFCMGLFVYEAIRSRRLSQKHLEDIEGEIVARREAEEQLKVLVESSPAAIFTTDVSGRVLLANDAAHRLFVLPPGALPGRSIQEYLPSLVNVPGSNPSGQAFRTVMQCRGRREDGDYFLADVWFSTYRTSVGSRLAAMVVDASEDLRTREESSLHQLLAGSRILIAAVSHEVRNVCGAIAVVHANLARSRALLQNKDFETLGTLIRALEKIATMELRQTSDQASGVDVSQLLEEVRIVVEPSLREEGIEIFWETAVGLPLVWADRQSLMQVFLNLIKNSERAMAKEKERTLTVSARAEREVVAIHIRDTGTGVVDPELLFRPFQPGAQATGLGLYLSRAFMRSFRGELRYEPANRGAEFIVELSAVFANEEQDGYAAGDSNFAYRRPQSVSGEPEPATRD